MKEFHPVVEPDGRDPPGRSHPDPAGLRKFVAAGVRQTMKMPNRRRFDDFIPENESLPPVNEPSRDYILTR
jgi:hypothetical protein